MNSRNSIIRGSLAELHVPEGRTLCFVSLGANLATAAGGPEVTVLRAFESLSALGVSNIVVSSLWQTAPLGCPEGSPVFVNAVAAFVPAMQDPHAMLAALHRIEDQAGRRRSGLSNEARVLDLDLLLFGTEEVDTPALALPHPRMAQRHFVLAPLAEIAPDLQIPGQDKSVVGLLQGIVGQVANVRMNIVTAAVVL